MIEPLDIKLPIRSEKEYAAARLDFISQKIKYSDMNREEAELEWEKNYPDGYENWWPKYSHQLNTHGQQKLIDKLNEVVAELNSTSGE